MARDFCVCHTSCTNGRWLHITSRPAFARRYGSCMMIQLDGLGNGHDVMSL